MTPEQLDEIEKLADAATPGPWGWTGSSEVADLWAAGGAIPVLRAWSDSNIAFMHAMREHALPLVKALREARAKNDAAHEVIQMIVEGDALKPEAYEPWGDEDSIYDACKRIIDEWRLP